MMGPRISWPDEVCLALASKGFSQADCAQPCGGRAGAALTGH